MSDHTIPEGFKDMLGFGLVEALIGRRSRRYFRGAEIPDGVLAHTSKHDPMPLSELEKLLVVTACAGNTGWHNMIYRAEIYRPHLSNYAGSASGRTFPSAAGFHTSITFFTDDDGLYVLDNRDAPLPVERDGSGQSDLEGIVTGLRANIRKLHDGRLGLPAETPHVEAHNTWVVNRPGTLLVIPVGDLAQHVILNLCYLLQNGQVTMDDVNGRTIPGMERFRGIADVDDPLPLTYFEQLSLSELTAELSTSCFAGALMLQAMGLGGWMFNGIDPFSMLGASGDPAVPGLGFRFDEDDRWPVPNVTGREGVMEAFCPPHYPDMRAAVEAVVERKFGLGGPFHESTPGPWKDTPTVRSAAQRHDAAFRDCITLQAQYALDTFGKFPGTVPAIYLMPYLQAHHLDLDFYDKFFERGAYLETHARHMARWHQNVD